MTDGDGELAGLSAAELSARVRAKDLSATEVTEAFLRRIEERASGNAFITTCPDYALRQAAKNPTGPLAGVPLGVKDNFDTAGIRTTYGSSIFRHHVPTKTAQTVTMLEQAGAILVGKTNQNEFAWGVTGQNSHWGAVANPIRPGKVAGGSSAGSAAALADGQCAIALGTDTGGSVRIPAACCGVVGFKPAFGAVSTDGTFPLAASMDTVGPMARSVRDSALVYQVLTGQPIPAPRIAGARIGVIAATGFEDEFAQLGARVDDFAMPDPAADLTAIFLAECAFTHLPWFPERREEYGADLQVKMDAAHKVTAVDYRKGLDALGQLQARIAQGLPVDVVMSPTIDGDPPSIDCWEPDVRASMGRYTRIFNYLGWPAIAIGNLQIAGPNYAAVLSVALAWEEAKGRPTPPAR